ncbi:MAG: hypothetical protein WC358_12350 [Ignavibacteria bacterium]
MKCRKGFEKPDEKTCINCRLWGECSYGHYLYSKPTIIPIVLFIMLIVIFIVGMIIFIKYTQ